jgi:hypothetical protein
MDYSSKLADRGMTLNRSLGTMPMVVGCGQRPNQGPTIGTTTGCAAGLGADAVGLAAMWLTRSTGGKTGGRPPLLRGFRSGPRFVNGRTAASE